MSMNINDAGLLTFVQNEATRVVREAVDEARKGITYPNFVPVDTSGDPFTVGTKFISTTKTGKAGYINGNADDMPLADASYTESTVPVYMEGIGYSWGYEEVARMTRLKADKAVAARTAYEQSLESLVFSGDSTHGIKGIKGITGSEATAASNITAWVGGTTTAQTIVTDIVGLIRKTGVTGAPTANRLILDSDQLTIADTTFFSGGSMSATDYLKRKFPGLQIRGVDSFQNGSSKNLYVAYKMSPSVLSLVLPMPHRFLPVFKPSALRFVVPGIFRTAGVNFKRKEDIAFAHS